MRAPRVTIIAEGNAGAAPAPAEPVWAGLAATATSVMFGFVPLAARGLYADGLSTWSLLCWRYLLALVIIVADPPHQAASRRCAPGRRLAHRPHRRQPRGGADPLLFPEPALARHRHRRPAVLYLPGGDPRRRAVLLQAAGGALCAAVRRRDLRWRRADC